MNNKKSFTLVEMLVVVAIIGILSGVILISTSGSTDKARLAKAQAFATTTQTQLGYDLISEWTFDGPTLAGSKVTNLDLQDSWGGNNDNITIYGNPIVEEEDCVSGKCLKFDSLSYITCGNGGSSLDVALGDSMTVETWAKINVIARTNSIMSVWTPWIYFVSSGMQRLYIKSNGADISINANTVMSSNDWHHIVFIYTKSNKMANFYLDGKLDGSPVFATGMDVASGNRLKIGGYGNASNFLNGSLDSIRIYDKGLTSSQIKQQYVAGLDSMLAKNLISKEEYNEKVELLAKN